MYETPKCSKNASSPPPPQHTHTLQHTRDMVATATATSTAQKVIIVHDVLGTLFSLSEPIAVIRELFADQLGSGSVADKFAELIVMDWYHATQRDFTNLSLNDAYTSIAQLFKNNVARTLLQAGLVPPGSSSDLETMRKQASNNNPFPHDGKVVTDLMQSLQRLKPRPGMVQAFSKTYRDASLWPTGVQSVDLWGATNGSRTLATALFEAALGNGSVASDQSAQNGVSVWSCDDLQVAKPSPKVYEAIKAIVTRGHADNNVSLWFVASHSWDTDAAARAGFKTCWTTYEEFHPASSESGAGGYLEPTLHAHDLDQAARKIWQWEQAHSHSAPS